MSAMMPSPNPLTFDPLYPRLKEHLVGSTGLTYYADKDADLVRRISRRLASEGIRDCKTYLAILNDPVRGPAELEALIAEITIGETYFFRHPEHFDALRTIVLPELLERNRGTQSLRIWCAGCADGPEAYSLSILLKREIAHRILGWDVSILGTDINRRGLARAREGKFEEWAFRSMSEDLKRECFSKEGRLWKIAPRYKEWVSFQYHNLVEDACPSLLNNLFAFDLVVCRNVMIYFGMDLMEKMIGRFYDCLVPGGWLLVGPTEPNMTSYRAFHTVNAPGVTLYQKPSPSAPLRDTCVFSFDPLPPSPATPPAVTEAPVPPPEAADPDPTLDDVRRHADRGEWASAAKCCATLLEKDNLNPVVHFYQALVLEQMHKRRAAERSLRRAIYLDRQSVLPHYYLGLFLQSRGDPRQAARSFENALRLLDTRRDTESFADADGITVAELKNLAKSHLETLRERE